MPRSQPAGATEVATGQPARPAPARALASARPAGAANGGPERGGDLPPARVPGLLRDAAPARARDRAKDRVKDSAKDRAQVEELEPRLLYSASALASALPLDAPAADAPALVCVTPAAVATPASSAARTAADAAAATATDAAAARQTTRIELVIVDAAVEDAGTLVDALLAQNAHAGAERQLVVVQLDAGRDGVAQITDILAGHSGLSAVHVIGHGDAAGMQLGAARLDAEALLQHAGAIVTWGRALGADADLLLYGCDLASGAAGQELVRELAGLTGADVAASTDRTGSALLGGDWVLEHASGEIEAAVAPAAALQAAWQQVLATASFQEGVSGYSGTQDTYIERVNGGTAHGGDGSLKVDDGSPNDMQTLIRFDNLFGTGAGQIPYGSAITSATLTVHVTNDDAGDVVTIHRMLVDWSELSTYDDLAAGVATDGSEASAALYTLDGGIDGAATFTGLAAVLQAWANGEAN